MIVGFLLMVALPVSAQEYTFSSKESIKDYIWGRAVSYGYNPQRAVAIANAESNFDINARNASSSASGVFEFINSTFSYYCIDAYHLAPSMAFKNDPKTQIECAVRMLANGGESHWSASEPVWNPSLSL